MKVYVVTDYCGRPERVFSAKELAHEFIDSVVHAECEEWDVE